MANIFDKMKDALMNNPDKYWRDEMNALGSLQGALGQQNADYEGLRNAAGQLGYSDQEIRNLHYQQMLAAKQSQLAMEQRIAFEHEAAKLNAISLEDISNPMFELSETVARDVWLAAFGSKWIEQNTLQGDHRVLSLRLLGLGQMETATASDVATMTFKQFVRLKGI